MSRTLLLLPAAFCVAVVSLGEPTRSLKAATSPAERRIEQALASPTEMEFIETPLGDVVDYMEDYHRIPIEIDHKALEEVGKGAETAVTASFRGLSLRSSLNLILSELELTYLIENEVLSITTIEVAKNRLTTKVYPVADLITRSDRPDGDPADFDTMIELITSTVTPETWEDVGGAGAIRGATLRNVDILVISQTYHGHRRIAALLDDLRLVTGAEQPPARPPADKDAKPAARDPFSESADEPAGDDPFAR